jgi:hypothetical protein
VASAFAHCIPHPALIAALTPYCLSIPEAYVASPLNGCTAKNHGSDGVFSVSVGVRSSHVSLPHGQYWCLTARSWAYSDVHFHASHQVLEPIFGRASSLQHPGVPQDAAYSFSPRPPRLPRDRSTQLHDPWPRSCRHQDNGRMCSRDKLSSEYRRLTSSSSHRGSGLG